VEHGAVFEKENRFQGKRLNGECGSTIYCAEIGRKGRLIRRVFQRKRLMRVDKG
jgi:hypothetical protein